MSSNVGVDFNGAKDENSEKPVPADSSIAASNYSCCSSVLSERPQERIASISSVPRRRSSVLLSKNISFEDCLDKAEDVIRHTELLEKEREEWIQLYQKRKEMYTEAKNSRKEGVCVNRTPAVCQLTDEDLKFCFSVPYYKSMVRQSIELDKLANSVTREVETLEEFVCCSVDVINQYQEARKEAIINHCIPDQEANDI